MMNTSLTKDSDNIWIRGAFMLLFGFIYSAAEMVMLVVVITQFLFVAFTKEKNEKVLTFGADLSEFLYQVFRFLTFASDKRPFPFTEWPKGQIGD